MKYIVLIFLSLAIVGCQSKKEYDSSLGCQTPVPNYAERQWYLADPAPATGSYGIANTAQPADVAVNVLIVADGLDSRHCDLQGRLNKQYNWNFYNNSQESSLSDDNMKRGTVMAGLIAANTNSIGISGVTNRSNINFFNLLPQNRTPTTEADAMIRYANNYRISVNNWAASSNDTGLVSANDNWRQAVDNGVDNLNLSGGIVYLFGAGESSSFYNSGSSAMRDANLNAYVNYHNVIAVCSVTSSGLFPSYGLTGANLFVCGPSTGSKSVVSTDVLGNGGYNGDKVNNDFTDKDSALIPGDISTSLVGGAAAIIASQLSSLSPDKTPLTWRDIRLILAESSYKVDPSDVSWVEGNNVASGSYNDETTCATVGCPIKKYYHSEKYGFGLVNVKKALELAKNWNSVIGNPLHDISFQASGGSVTDATGVVSTITIAEDSSGQTKNNQSVSVISSVTKIEFVEVTITSAAAGDLNNAQIELISNDYTQGSQSSNTYPGITSHLISQPVAAGLTNDGKFIFPAQWVFGSVRDLGRSPVGTWTLKITPAVTGAKPRFLNWKIRFYGRIG